jgi:hypothetical protein
VSAFFYEATTMQIIMARIKRTAGIAQIQQSLFSNMGAFDSGVNFSTSTSSPSGVNSFYSSGFKMKSK